MQGFLSPAELSHELVQKSIVKASAKTVNTLLLGFLAGAYIALAAFLATTVGTGNWPGFYGLQRFFVGAVFSVGLMLVLIPGAELFTGNNLMVMGLLQGKIRAGSMLRNWVLVWVANFVGSLFVALLVAGSGLLDTAVGVYTVKVGLAKVGSNNYFLSHNLAYFLRAVGCNWLVCLAVMQAVAAKGISGKVWGIFFPIMAFVAVGFEHVIANMYFIPAAIFAAKVPAVASHYTPAQLASLNWGSMFSQNLITVTLGNLVGGALLCGTIYWLVYVKGTK